jgi:AraC-like DNA-binding protein
LDFCSAVLYNRIIMPHHSRLTDPERIEEITSDSSPLQASAFEHRDAAESLFDMHYEVELGLLTSGGMIRIWENHEAPCGPGDLWLNGIWEPHGFRLTTAPSRGLVFLFRPELLTRITRGLPGNRDWLLPFLLPPAGRPRPLPGTAADRLRVTEGYSPGESPLRDTLMLLTLLERLPEPADTRRDNPQGGSPFLAVLPAVELSLRSRNLIQVAEAASACGMSESVFERHFRQVMGISFGRFGLNNRLKEAANRLKDSPQGIKEIAEEWGFSDLSHFYRAFRQVYRTTPADYRARYR